MEIRLDIQRIIRAPFGAEASFFRLVADGAITLFPIDPVEWMPERTMHLLGIEIGNGGAVTHDVLGLCQGLQMLRIDACAITAGMIDDEVIWQVTMPEEPCDTMGAPIHPAKVKGSIAVSVERAMPDMALSDVGPFAIEAFYFGRRSMCVAYHGPHGNRTTGVMSIGGMHGMAS